MDKLIVNVPELQEPKSSPWQQRRVACITGDNVYTEDIIIYIFSDWWNYHRDFGTI